MDYEQLVEKVTELETKLTQLEKSDRYTFEKLIQMLDGRNIQTGKTTGTKIGTATDQKVALHGVSPTIQDSAIADFSATSVSGSGDDSTINSNFSDIQTKLNAVITALENKGIIST